MLKVALIGLDTTHSIEFTRRMVGTDVPPEQCVHRLQPTMCMSFETPFQNREGLAARTEIMQSMGVRVTEDFDEAVRGADALMLEINDPALHLEYFMRVAALGKPVFLDKPFAPDMAQAHEICAVAAANGTKFFTASSLRFDPAVVAASAANPTPKRAYLWGPLGRALAGSSVVWYGVHTVEMLQRLMGRGATSVRAIPDVNGTVFVAEYGDGRRGVLEMTEGNYRYGGVLHCAKGGAETVFTIGADLAFYGAMVREIETFFHGESVGVALDDMLESMAILQAADRAYTSGESEPVER